MTLPENTLKYDICSLQELRKVVVDRKIPPKYTHAQSHTKKSRTKKEKNERRKLVAALQRGDATATFRLLDLLPELRDEVYRHFFMNPEVRCYYQSSANGVAAHNLQRVPEQIRDEMSAVFNAVLELREAKENKIAGVLSSGKIRIGINLELFLGTGFSSIVWKFQAPKSLQLYCPESDPLFDERLH